MILGKSRVGKMFALFALIFTKLKELMKSKKHNNGMIQKTGKNHDM